MGRRKLCKICNKPIKKEDEKNLIVDTGILLLCPICYELPCWDGYKNIKRK